MNQTYNELLLLKVIKRLGEEGGPVPTSVLRERTGISASRIYKWLAGLRQKGYITCTPGKGSKCRYTLTHAGIVALVHFGSSREHVDKAFDLLRVRRRHLDELAPQKSLEEYGALRVLLEVGAMERVGRRMTFRLRRGALEHTKLDMKLEACLAQY